VGVAQPLQRSSEPLEVQVRRRLVSVDAGGCQLVAEVDRGLGVMAQLVRGDVRLIVDRGAAPRDVPRVVAVGWRVMR